MEQSTDISSELVDFNCGTKKYLVYLRRQVKEFMLLLLVLSLIHI